MTPESEKAFRDWGNALAKTVRDLKAQVDLQEDKINVLSTNLFNLRNDVAGYKTLLIDLRGEDAVELHSSMPLTVDDVMDKHFGKETK